MNHNDASNNRPTSNATLSWRAFQYVHGEFSADDNEVFEQQMLEDADLCAMVTEASLLTSAIVSITPAGLTVQPTPNHTPPRREVRKTAAVIVSICCCVSVLALLSVVTIEHSDILQAETPMIDAELLVSVWADVVEEADDLEPGFTVENELDVPDWMLAGISELENGKNDQVPIPSPSDKTRELL